MEKNLKLALVGHLMDHNILPPFDIKKFFELNLAEKYDPCADYVYKPIPEIEAYFSELELREEDLLKIEHLSFKGGDEIYRHIWPQWDGEDDYFSISSLDGLERYGNVKSLEIGGILYVEKPLNIDALGKLPLEKNSSRPISFSWIR